MFMAKKTEFIATPSLDTLVGVLSKNGLRSKFTTFVMEAFFVILSEDLEVITWKDIYLRERFLVAKNSSSNLPAAHRMQVNTRPNPRIGAMFPSGFCFSRTADLFDHFFSLLNSFSPLFVLTTEKVSKKIRKFSRGKSGKYFSFWSYLPAQKRRTWLLRNLLYHLPFDTSKTLTERIANSIFDLLKNPESHFIPSSINQTYRVIFKNHRYTLMKNLKRQKK